MDENYRVPDEIDAEESPSLTEEEYNFAQEYTDEELEKKDVMADLKVQSFVGGSSARENLSLIPKENLPLKCSLQESDRETILCGLEHVISRTHMEKVWECIWRRWQYLMEGSFV